MPMSPKVVVPVVINTCHGGFDLSQRACHLIAGRKACLYDAQTAELVDGMFRVYIRDLPRHDPDLVAVVNELGAAAANDGAKLVIKHVVVTIVIDESDGYERIAGAGSYVTD